MSFPYRLLTGLTHSETLSVIGLRLLNAGLFAYGLVLFRRVMIRASASTALTHVALAIFVLIPIVPQLAAHINYDNVIMVLLPLMCLAAISLAEGFKYRHINVTALLGFISVCLFISVVKYAALPFVLAAMVFVGFMLLRSFNGALKIVGPAIRTGWRRASTPTLVMLAALSMVGFMLFMQRYGANLAHYATPVPDCGEVLTAEQCSAYGPWGRDYLFSQTKDPEFQANPVVYMDEWVRGMWLRTFFSVNGPSTDYTNYRPVWLPSRAAIVIVLFGLFATALCFKEVFYKRPYLALFAVIVGGKAFCNSPA